MNKQILTLCFVSILSLGNLFAESQVKYVKEYPEKNLSARARDLGISMPPKATKLTMYSYVSAGRDWNTIMGVAKPLNHTAPQAIASTKHIGVFQDASGNALSAYGFDMNTKPVWTTDNRANAEVVNSIMSDAIVQHTPHKIQK